MRFILALLIVATSTLSAYDFSKKRHPLIVVLSIPRSVTTALERSFIERGDLEIIHEPWCSQWVLQYGKFDESIPDFVKSLATFEEMRDYLLDLSVHKSVFVKDFSFSTYPMILEDPAFLADPDVCFIFYIRNPRDVIASYYKREPDFRDSFVDYKALYEIFKEIARSKKQQPLVINSEDLLNNPPQALQKICSGAGIPFTEKMLSWEPGMLEMWRCYSTWHQDAAHSSAFYSKPSSDEDPFASLPSGERERLECLYERNIAYYELLKAYTE